ncbi:hypothetical protein [Desulfovibrio inopinatus]|uniref:hypothetical protein n=1 Tax=Desulfovibrio inopinatus TaxID=102109 RepID=UPI00041F77F2|nr:hypothetical protein [Desulfovibrio inopinatus]
MHFIHSPGQLPDGRRICIYGMGTRGAELFQAISETTDLDVLCFVDSFTSSEYLGKPVHKLDTFARLYEPQKDYVVIASAFYAEISIGLVQAGIHEWSVYEELPDMGEARNSAGSMFQRCSNPLGYRDHETMAKKSLPNWRIAQRHNLDHFERFGFPVRISTFQETRPLLNTMQEGRFEKLQDELGGLEPADVTTLRDACIELVTFQRRHYPGNNVVIPLDTMLAMLVVYKKLTAVAPGFRSILEVGPGCGYLSFFLKGHPGLQNYTLTESCESFYILQDAVNRHVFGEGFQQMIHAEPVEEWFIRDDDPLQKVFTMTSMEAVKKARHYPWWRLGDIAASQNSFDVVNSNANLLEFNPDALRDYLSLFHRTVKAEGVFFVHCFGCETPEKNRLYLYENLYQAGFAPLFISHGAHIKAREAWQMHIAGQCECIQSHDARKFVVGHGVFVKEGHPLFASNYSKDNYKDMYITDFTGIETFFKSPSEKSRFYSKEEIISTIHEQLHVAMQEKKA